MNEIAVKSPNLSNEESIEARINLAYGAQLTWRQLPIKERLEKLKQLSALLVEERTELAALIESPYRQGYIETLTAEIMPLADSLTWLTKRARRILRPRHCSARLTPLWLGSLRSTVHRVPHGLVLIIAPGNYPLYLTGIQVTQALAAGNAVMIKPAPGAERVTAKLVDLLIKSGVPAELMIVLGSNPEQAKQAIEIGVDKVLLTGSSTTGRNVLKGLTDTLTPATLELSGCDAVYVLPSADIHRVCRILLFGLRLNGGATCMAPRRVFVSSKISEVFHRVFKEVLASTLEKQGEQKEELKEWSTLVPLPVYKKLYAGYEQAIGAGAKLFESAPLDPPEATMEKRESLNNAASVVDRSSEQINAGNAGSKTVRMGQLILTDVHPDMDLCSADTFAPLLMIIPVDDWAHALQADSQCPYALTASIYGAQEDALRLANFISAGAITINDSIVPLADPQTPFGGRGESGFGVTQGDEGLLEMTTPQVVSIRRGTWLPHAAPLTKADGMILDGVLQLSHSGSWTGRWKGLVQIVQAVLAKRNKQN